MKMNKHKNIRTTSLSILLTLIMLVPVFFLSSCKNELKGLLKDLTENVEVIGYKVYYGKNDSDYAVQKLKSSPDHPDELYISSEEVTSAGGKCKISFELRNPQRYVFATEQQAMEKTIIEYDEKLDVSIVDNNIDVDYKQSTNPLYIDLIFTASDLQGANGKEITPTIKSIPIADNIPAETQSLLKEFCGLKIVSNARPQDVGNTYVYHKDSSQDNDKYILFFNLPEKSKLNKIHKDITELVIEIKIGNKVEKKELKIKINDDGTIVPLDNELHVYNTGDEEQFKPCNDLKPFEKYASDQSFYWVTDNPFNADLAIEYRLYLKDDYGLTSVRPSIAVNKEVVKPVLGSPAIFIGSTKIESVDELLNLSQDKNSSEATLTIKAPAKVYALRKDAGNPESVVNCFRYKVNGVVQTPEYITFKPYSKTDYYSNSFDCVTNPWLLEHADDPWIEEDGTENKNKSYRKRINELKLVEEDCSNTQIDYTVSVNGEKYSTDTAIGEIKVVLPCGESKLDIKLTRDGFITNDKDPYNKNNINVTRIRLYAKDKSQIEIGTKTFPFTSLSDAMDNLTFPLGTDNAYKAVENLIYVSSDITENSLVTYTSKDAKKPAVSVNICKDSELNNNPKVTFKEGFAIPDGSTVKLENLEITGNIDVGENVILKLINVVFSGKITAGAGSRVVLDGSTQFIQDAENGIESIVYLTSVPTATGKTGALVQVAKGYTPTSLVKINTVEKHPLLDTKLLEGESGINNSLVSLPDIICTDIDGSKPSEESYLYFVFANSAYYLDKAKTTSFGKTIYYGVLKNSAASIVEPTVGGFTVTITPGTKEYTVTLSHQRELKATINKLELYIDGDLYKESTTNKISIPSEAGKYVLVVTFEYGGITYKDEFMLTKGGN